MKHKTYRLCLLSVVIIAMIGGIFYYQNYMKKQSTNVDGTFVKQNFVEECENV